MALAVHNAPCLENPYAWDIIDGNVTPFSKPYDELGSLSTFLLVNYSITSVVGGILSLLMLYLVLFKTSGALKGYQNMLLICCITDLIYWAVDNFMWMKLKEKDGVFIVKMEGLAGNLSRPYRVLMSHFINNFLTASQTLGLCCIALVVTIPTLFFTYASFNSSPNVRPGFNYGQLWYQEFPMPQLLFGDVRSIYQKGFFFWGGGIIAVSYILTISIGRRTLQRTRRMDFSYSEKTKRLQNQLTNFMFVQATIPLFISVVPILLIVIPAFFYVDTGMMCFYCVIAISWIPLLNPIITITVIVPFRRIVCGAFRKQVAVNTSSNRSTTA
ncbi:unnamed protein product [Bursaphelenchus xylophilus]|uniref:(pine wood nematode) hypothetical protein n=1 Tax=Bursaphelenchus xylophilus TaxID=6326 RepID=A0A1I7RJW4_BURXY|nr:unnamed protein product [Bursaphelenchus xylophilus]CAG9129112.1 unnamed protein product [Bursaphelenchus xylophilus]